MSALEKPSSAARRATKKQTPLKQSRWRGWLILNLVLVFLLGALLGWRQINSPDIGFHLSSARWMVEHGTFPQFDPFSFTFTDHRYFDLQWLFQLAIYGAHQLGGTSLLLLVKLAATFTFWGLLLWRARRREGSLPQWAALLLLPVALADGYEERPQLFSWIFGSLLLLILEEHYRNNNRRWLWALPVIMLLWVNSHSLFVLGLVIMGVYALWELRRGRACDKRLLLAAGCAGIVCLINPYFWQGLLLPLTQFRDIQSGQIFKSTLTGIFELQSPFSFNYYFLDGRFVLFQSAFYWHLYCILAVAGLIGGWRRWRVPEIVIGVLFLYLFSKGNKNFGYFVMATFPMIANGLDGLGANWRQWLSQKKLFNGTFAGKAVAQFWAGGTTVLAVGFLFLVASGWFYKQAWSPNKTGTGFNADALPVQACDFLREHQISGRVLTTFSSGGYVHWAARLSVSIYGVGEVVGPDFFAKYIEAKSPEAFPRYLDEWQPTIAVVPFTDVPFWLFYLNSRTDWRLVQHDDRVALFLHESVTGPPALPALKPGDDYPVYSREQMKSLLQQAAARPVSSFRQWLRGSDVVPQPCLRMAGFYLHTGKLHACIGVGLEGVSRCEVMVPEYFLTLGHAFNYMQDYELSDFCFQTFLKNAADPVEKSEISAIVQSRPERLAIPRGVN